MAIYTSSPLGLITDSDMSDFYKPYSDLNKYQGSLFSSQHIIQRKNNSKTPFDVLSFKSASTIHQNDVYNMKTSNIIEKLNDLPSMRLKMADFAYCKDFGVYPNNRLIVCRRFPNPVTDDLNTVTSQPISTLVSWFSEESNIIDFSFSEKWVEADVSFKNVLNDIGGDIGLKKINIELGSALEAASNLVPLPGVTETFQRRILQAIGIIEPPKRDDKGNVIMDTASIIPSGDPNLIKESMVRGLIGADSPGSGLIGKFNIQVKCKWEQKFISGVDPTFVYYDILRTVLSFGSSDAVFYLGKKSNLPDMMKNVIKKLETNPFALIQDFIKGIITTISDVAKDLDKALKDINKKSEQNAAKKDDSLIANPLDGVSSILGDFAKPLDDVAKALTSTIAKKYKIPLMGIVTSLTGLSSTPWHITIGNPIRPIFSSGDMVCKDVKVNLGSQLSFNDLPSYIECEFTLESARNLGADEIFEKLSSGALRVSEQAPSFYNSDDISNKSKAEPADRSTGVNDIKNTLNENKEDDSNITVDSNLQTKSGNSDVDSGEKINRDPNSIDPTIGKTTQPPTTGKFTYEVVTDFWETPPNRVIAKDSNGVIAYKGERYYRLSDSDGFLEDAKDALNDES